MASTRLLSVGFRIADLDPIMLPSRGACRPIGEPERTTRHARRAGASDSAPAIGRLQPGMSSGRSTRVDGTRAQLARRLDAPRSSWHMMATTAPPSDEPDHIGVAGGQDRRQGRPSLSYIGTSRVDADLGQAGLELADDRLGGPPAQIRAP